MPRTRILTTERLILETVSMDDLEITFEINSDAEVMKYIAVPDTQLKDTEKFLKDILKFGEDHPGMGVWKLSLKDGTFLGFGLLNHPKLSATKQRGGPVQLGYRIHKAHWGQGYVTEVSLALVDYAFEVLKLDRLIAIAEEPNRGSTRVMEKVGMTYVGITEEFYGLPLVEYHMTRDMWEKIKEETSS